MCLLSGAQNHTAALLCFGGCMPPVLLCVYSVAVCIYMQLKVLCEGVVETVGRLRVGDWSTPFTAHPKLDATTGALDGNFIPGSGWCCAAAQQSWVCYQCTTKLCASQNALYVCGLWQVLPT